MPGSQDQRPQAPEMACWHHRRLWIEHQSVLKIYQDDEAEPQQEDAQRMLGNGSIGD